MSTLHAEVEHLKRSIVTVNIDKLLASDWGDERGEYASDEEFAKGTLQKIGYYDLLDPTDEDEIGIAIEGEWDDGEISFLGVVPA